jgi:hypothetical protein
MMYSFAARGDCAVWDEPFYAAYLDATGLDHPMRAEIIAEHEADPDRVASICKGPVPQGQRYFYQKQMTMHMIDGFDRRWMRSCVNVFLIRHPARVVASYAKKREGATFEDIGFIQQEQLFNEVADWSGAAPLVIDSEDWTFPFPVRCCAGLLAAIRQMVFGRHIGTARFTVLPGLRGPKGQYLRWAGIMQLWPRRPCPIIKGLPNTNFRRATNSGPKGLVRPHR